MLRPVAAAAAAACGTWIASALRRGRAALLLPLLVLQHSCCTLSVQDMARTAGVRGLLERVLIGWRLLSLLLLIGCLRPFLVVSACPFEFCSHLFVLCKKVQCDGCFPGKTSEIK